MYSSIAGLDMEAERNISAPIEYWTPVAQLVLVAMLTELARFMNYT
jgi:hypothetical protein